MPNYKIFPKLPLLSYIEKVHIRYRPGAQNVETCRRLMLMLLNPQIHKKYPQLKYSYELLSYNERPEIHLTVSPNVPLRFYADLYTLEDIHRIIDSHQYKAHVSYTKTHSLEADDGTDD
ncbi:hypothetical protein BEWA_020660 [Theileria equi strain WA]|uniref:Ribosomal protein/NADH dehydrogenase domain-containing protein n=1 Tax=Theileria equi strain WA TaxID=1537102 RepID=L0AWD2_THEEQ|nr:hypothetical protein BEWA_020660 [Theileria equi strain WA]AFZ79219.1 hypothetical protein BEWA_020660 [Theileria equi strain WA]|eukprot:XP_004828885.1 hypothetical protein BEWA_020660 [Theileria equi strain WA]